MTTCNRCVMDSTAQEFKPTPHGCNFCDGWHRKAKAVIEPNSTYLAKKLQSQVGRPYDSLLGISGGKDSSYVAYLAWQNKMHTLLIHLDNGYDTQESIDNMKRIQETTDYPLINIQADPLEFRDIQLAYLKASVINIEAPTDHALAATTYTRAVKHGIRFILNGSNWATEGIRPQSWGYRTDDVTNLRQIHRIFGTIPIRTFPTMSLMQKHILKLRYHLEFFSPLNHVAYNQDEVRDTLKEAFDWREYPGKHGESVFTRFYQNYILPRKFGVDKRKMFLSTLICSEQISRDDALRELESFSYPEFEGDLALVLKRLGLHRDEFEELMLLPVKKHQDYPNEEYAINLVRAVRRMVKA